MFGFCFYVFMLFKYVIFTFSHLMIYVPTPKIAVCARSMEFADALKTTVKYQAAGQTFTTVANNTWQIQYNYVSINATVQGVFKGKKQDIEGAVDGMNDQGFSAAALWFDRSAYFPPQEKGAINATYLVDYLLANYTRVQDVIKDVESGKLKVWADEAEYKIYPLHYPLHDKTGVTGILEFTKEKITAKINPTKVCTNAPEIDWHIENLGYYTSLTFASPQIKVGEISYPTNAQGQGFRGIPGDAFPASRFVRTFYGLKCALDNSPPKDSKEAVLLAMHLLNSVDFPKGQCQTTKMEGKELRFVWALYIIVKDLVNNKLYYRTYDSFGCVEVDLATCNFVKENGIKHPLADLPPIPNHDIQS